MVTGVALRRNAQFKNTLDPLPKALSSISSAGVIVSNHRLDVVVWSLFRLDGQHRFLTTLFTLSVYFILPGCRASPASRIEAVLKQNHAVLDQMIASFSQGDQFAELSRSELRAINTDGCPNDFRAAYLAFVYAWDDLAAAKRRYLEFQGQSTAPAVIIESAIRGAFGDPFGKTAELLSDQQQLQQQHALAGQRVETAWHRVEEIAILHGARLPRPSR